MEFKCKKCKLNFGAPSRKASCPKCGTRQVKSIAIPLVGKNLRNLYRYSA